MRPARKPTTTDPLVVAAQIVVALQTLVSREVEPGVPAVITLGALLAGTTFNVIPDRAQIMGTIRAYDAGLMDQLEARIETVAKGVASSLRGEGRAASYTRYPPTI